MFPSKNHNQEESVRRRFLGRQVIELHRIPPLGDFHPQDFLFFFFSFSFLFRAETSRLYFPFHTTVFFLFFVSRMVAWSLSSGEAGLLLPSQPPHKPHPTFEFIGKKKHLT